MMLDRFGEIELRRVKIDNEIVTRLTVGQRNLAHAVTTEQVERSRGDRLARELEDQISRFSNQLG